MTPEAAAFSRSSAFSSWVSASLPWASPAAKALIGIGRMYGPIRPETKASGSSAAITVKVARIVGLPTSSVAWRVAARGEVQPSCRESW